MSTLHVRNVPDDLYEAIRTLAERRDTSISAEVLRLLERALQTERPDLDKLLAQIERSRPKAKAGAPSAAWLLREDRDR